MKLKEKLLADYISARFNKEEEKKLLLSTVLGELDRVSKDPTDDVVIRVIKKVSEGCKECHKDSEVALLAVYLPQMMTEEEITQAIYDFVGNFPQDETITSAHLGKFMQYMKTNHEGKYDGKMANELFKLSLNI